jgi:hypothetical protein
MVGPVVCVATSAGAAVGTAMLLGRIWNACDVGVNSSANSMALLFFYIPVVFVVSVVLTGAVYATTQRVSRAPALAGGAAAIAAVAVVWATLSLFHGGDYPSPICDNNIPRWWPDWIPL